MLPWRPAPTEACSRPATDRSALLLQDKLYPSNNCVNASKAHAYNTFTGNNSFAAQLASVSNYLTTGDVAYGWQSATCSALNSYICGLPFSVFTCYPPPSPPKPPPVPPRPPVPPMPPHGEATLQRFGNHPNTHECSARTYSTSPRLPRAAGAPMPDDYFFCDALYGVCFRMVPTPASYAASLHDCAKQGGYLPIYNETAKQVGRGCLE